ncbi:hypothetical protein RHMOL_Rhmol12G0046900 [Rhododendron molle]|uniref:Uncharacterized protein n=1 Tax=Rhododendron molle TaxID=49168 RepID=A0ACC0LFK3_RHOML|nr:hypothetical protein RHMOL_Rhmol12G0046900 [Rhododendron molle]
MHLQALKLLKRLCAGVKSLNNSEAYKLHAKDALVAAAKLGIHEVIEEIVESFPDLIWADAKSLNLFQIAVLERHVNVFNLIYQMGANQQLLIQMKDPSGNNLLHLAGKQSPRNKNNPVIGAALQMQRDRQWFEVILCGVVLFAATYFLP